MRLGKNAKYAFAGAALVLLIIVAFASVQPEKVLTFAGKAFGEARGAAGEFINVQTEVTGSSWVPSTSLSVFGGGFGTGVEQSFWTVDGEKYSTASATLKVKITYGGIKVGSLNATAIQFFMTTDPTNKNPKSYLINTNQNGINSATDGTWDHYSANPFTGSKSLDAIATDLSLPTDGSTQVYNYYYVEVKGVGAKSGQTLTVTIGPKTPTPASNVWQYYTESSSATSDSGSVTFSSWTDGSTLLVFGVVVVVAYAVFGRKRRR